jgi:hypothetical protein
LRHCSRALLRHCSRALLRHYSRALLRHCNRTLLRPWLVGTGRVRGWALGEAMGGLGTEEGASEGGVGETKARDVLMRRMGFDASSGGLSAPAMPACTHRGSAATPAQIFESATPVQTFESKDSSVRISVWPTSSPPPPLPQPPHPRLPRPRLVPPPPLLPPPPSLCRVLAHKWWAFGWQAHTSLTLLPYLALLALFAVAYHRRAREIRDTFAEGGGGGGGAWTETERLQARSRAPRCGGVGGGNGLGMDGAGHAMIWNVCFRPCRGLGCMVQAMRWFGMNGSGHAMVWDGVSCRFIYTQPAGQASPRPPAGRAPAPRAGRV